MLHFKYGDIDISLKSESRDFENTWFFVLNFFHFLLKLIFVNMTARTPTKVWVIGINYVWLFPSTGTILEQDFIYTSK